MAKGNTNRAMAQYLVDQYGMDDPLIQKEVNRLMKDPMGKISVGEEAAGIFPIGRYMELAKNSPKAAKGFVDWYKGLKPNKWGTKIFPGVSNTNLPAVVNTASKAKPGVSNMNLPATSGLGSAEAITLSNKAKAQLGAFGAAGLGGMMYGASGSGDFSDNPYATINDKLAEIDNDDKDLLNALAAKKGTATGKFPYPMTPGSVGSFSDQVGSLNASPYQDALLTDIDRTNAYIDDGQNMSDEDIINNVVADYVKTGNGMGPSVDNASKVVAIDENPYGKDKVVVAKKAAPAKKTRTRSVSAPKSVAPAPAPKRRAATADPLNLFGNKNGYNPFSNKERAANGQAPLSFVDFFRSGVGTR